ncbi:hypothetical protein JOF29_002732 [Kribbella aluminosa]|uniref:Low temperature requirement A protein (LtrA) n=1 Tax=Kribbella aluminosa TaxID=416017 RepID=A0ABS4UJ69_9ACTN|nr:hypothetical protein [Kribbella aluminosa]MBP2351649.1 hypothetical protein [Kribbella aluminosa]
MRDSIAWAVAEVILLYVVLRWAAVPILERLPAGLGHVVGLLAALLLLPEYAVTVMTRRASGRPAPFAHAYGELVCAVAVGVYRVAGILISVLHTAAGRIGHRAALVGGIGVVVIIHAV